MRLLFALCARVLPPLPCVPLLTQLPDSSGDVDVVGVGLKGPQLRGSGRELVARRDE